MEYAKNAEDNGIDVIICAAGMAAHLAGAIAANTTLPVIGIPCKSAVLDGMDALLSTVQMPSGIPVATVAIDGAVNSALLAIEILSLGEPELEKKLADKRAKDTATVLEKNKAIEEKADYVECDFIWEFPDESRIDTGIRYTNKLESFSKLSPVELTLVNRVMEEAVKNLKGDK